MKILFLALHKWPHIGGVEKHVYEISQKLKRKGQKVTIISEKDIKYPHIKFLGLLYIWFWLFRKRKLIQEADIVHCHDVFIWYLPFRFLYPSRPVYTTFHGWEGIYPIPWKNIFLKRLANKLSWGTIAVGKYIGKYYGIKADKIVYGGVTPLYNSVTVRKNNLIVFVGRLEKDTGVLEFLKWLKVKGKRLRVDFLGDGSLRKECSKYGVVYGFTDPTTFYKKAEYCVPGGYLSYIEAKAYGCKIKVFSDNPLKRDYWKEILSVKKFPTWDELAEEYLDIWLELSCINAS